MYNSTKTAQIIKATAKARGILVKNMLTECGLNINTLSTMTNRSSWISPHSLALIADYLDVSVDYLLGRTDNPNAHKK